MNRQVGVAKPSPNGLISRGLMLPHLVMPDDVSGTGEVIRWIAENLPRDTWFNLMFQYHPDTMQPDNESMPNSAICCKIMLFG